MKNQAITNALQGPAPVTSRKDWTKPVLDILELENAQHGNTHLPDGVIKHTSG